MGDRANIFISEPTKDNPKNGMYFYTHWGGNTLLNDLHDALIRGKDRWSDDQYLPRIIFCQMVQDDWESTTGYGLSTRIGDNGHPILVVDTENQMVGITKEGNEPTCHFSMSFEEFTSKSKEEIKELFDWS
jgi:hypothetical protein